MSIPIKTNQLSVSLDYAALAKRYSVFVIGTTDSHFSRGASILDDPLLSGDVCSVYFDSGRRFYVLLHKDIGNKTNLKKVLAKSEEGDRITISEADADSIDQRTVLSLLLNALGSFELDFLRFNNLTGHLYCFHPKWLRKGSGKYSGMILKIPCLEIAITDDLRLTIAVRTFTSEILKKQIVFRKKTFEQYPKYILAAHNTLRRKLSADTDQCFILRQTQGDKTEIPFLDIQSLAKYELSKMGVVTQLLSCFNEKYAGVCQLSFLPIDTYLSVNSPKRVIKENNRVVQHLLSETGIRIVDYIEDDYSSRFCGDLQAILREKYKVEAPIGKRISKQRLNLCVIHNALYYEGDSDPHEKEHEGVPVQHITLEDFMGNANAAIQTVVHELLIKHDIDCRRLSLFDWTALGIQSDLSFGMSAMIAEEERYFFMTIHPDGSFDFTEQQLDLFTFNEYTKCVNIFTDSEDVAGIIRYPDGDINIIRDTSWFTIPEIEKIHDALAAGNTYLRGREKRTELLSSITDIKSFSEGNSQYYFVGIIGEGMRTAVNDAAVIRKIEPYADSELRFDDLLPLMNVSFVRNGQLTVVPFPFKYLREYVRTIADN